MTQKAPNGALLNQYSANGFFCELLDQPQEKAVSLVIERLNGLEPADLKRRAKEAIRHLFNLGITFTVYTDRDSIDRVLPFDAIPRVLGHQD